MRKYCVTVFSIFLFTLSLVCPSPGQSSETSTNILSSIRYWPDPNYTRIVIDLAGSTTYFHKYLPSPDRLYIDIHDTIITGKIDPIQIEDGVIKRVRAGQHDKKTVRVVLDLTGMVAYNIFPLTSPDRLVVDIYRSTEGPRPSIRNMVRAIVIDPGHGGKDPGAIGKRGLLEKDIVLDVGVRLRRLIEKRLGIKVIMTRETDIFIPLEERTAIANTKGADLFVSIHTNASPKENVRGAETYLLGRATDKDAMATASRENSATEQSLSALQLILVDLMNSAKNEESFRLAHYVQDNLIDSLEPRYKINDLGVKQAPFYVLVNARMPSILAEISFISNPAEERLLARDRYRQAIAEAIFEGIKKYIKATPVLAYPREAINLPVK